MSEKEKTRILIVGGGFGGVKAALDLCERRDVQITLLSDHSHFRYYPGLYHTATGGNRAGARIHLNKILEDRPIKFVRGTATKLDRKNQHIVTQEGQKLTYDILILAIGNVTNYFDIKGLADHAYGIKSSEEAERFKKHLHDQLIKDGCPDPNYVIAGAGPTGIELAGALPGYLRDIMKKHGLKDCELNIKLVEAAPHLLPHAPEDISRTVAKRLEHLGITLMLGKPVEGLTADTLTVGGKPIQSQTVIWTAGVTNHPFFKSNGFTIADHGKVAVDEYLQAEQNVFVIGDNANTEYSGLAQTALYDAEFVAKNISRTLEGKMPESYVPKKPIIVIPVGPRWASVEWGRAHYSGFIGWILRQLADFLAFNDLESWTKATGQWFTGMEDDDLDCPGCKPKT